MRLSSPNVIDGRHQSLLSPDSPTIDSGFTFNNGTFIVERKIGEGAFGRIYSGTILKTNQEVAIKVAKQTNSNAQLTKLHLSHEYDVYRFLHYNRESSFMKTVLDQNKSNFYSSSSFNLKLKHVASESNLSTLRITEYDKPDEMQTEDGFKNSATENELKCSALTPVVSCSETSLENVIKGEEILNVLGPTWGIPTVYWYGKEDNMECLVMELCGPSLDDLLYYCTYTFSLKTVLMLADQLLDLVQYVHDKGLIYRDFKPSNFCMGIQENMATVFMLDLGLCVPYADLGTGCHNSYKEGNPFIGTAKYCSNNAHKGIQLSRRDDLESLGYMLIYFLTGNLPWCDVSWLEYMSAVEETKNNTTKQDLLTLIGEKKDHTNLDELCALCPTEFLEYMKHCRGLGFTQKPDYDYLRGLLRKCMEVNGNNWDWDFDWFQKRDKEIMEEKGGVVMENITHSIDQ